MRIYIFQAAADYASRFPREVPVSFDRELWRKGLSARQDGTAAVRGAGRFVIISRKNGSQAKIIWNNYKQAPGKTLFKGLLVKEGSGKKLLDLKDVKPKAMREDYSFTLGTPGTRYFVNANSDGNSMWLIPGSKDYTVCHDSAAAISLLSNVATRLEMEQMPNENIKITYTPLHMGNYGITVKDAEGKVLFAEKGFKSETKLKGETRNVTASLSGINKKRKLVLELFSGNGAQLRVSPRKLLTRP